VACCKLMGVRHSEVVEVLIEALNLSVNIMNPNKFVHGVRFMFNPEFAAEASESFI